MNKHQLIALHGLKPEERDLSLTLKDKDKSYKIYCQWCAKSFQGRNRAKVYQHISGSEHRRRWRAACSKTEVQEDREPGELDHKPSNVGTCKGLRLGSEIGGRTRLGNEQDLWPVWKRYCQFAKLDRTETLSGGSCHTIQPLNHGADYVLTSNSCKGSDIPVACLLWYVFVKFDSCAMLPWCCAQGGLELMSWTYDPKRMT